MIVAQRKTIPDLLAIVEKHRKVLLLGCGTCVTVCLAGGQREVSIIASSLRMAAKLKHIPLEVDETTIERQCEDAFIDLLAQRVPEYDAICSMGCGAGVQALAERFPKLPVYPGLNTQFMGILEAQGVWTEKCSGCGNCRLGEFAGICPLTRCAKRMLNGPCGGSQDGKCEVNANLDCGWQLINDRAVALGVLERFDEIVPPHDWSTGLDGGPRKVVREDQCIAGLGPHA